MAQGPESTKGTLQRIELNAPPSIRIRGIFVLALSIPGNFFLLYLIDFIKISRYVAYYTDRCFLSS